jgi:hypothetical protein
VSQEKKIHLTRLNPANPGLSGSQPATAGNGITYHGGPLILGTTKVYYILYGNWTGNNASTILQNFASNIGGSAYFNINTTYYDSTPTSVSNSVLSGTSILAGLSLTLVRQVGDRQLLPRHRPQRYVGAERGQPGDHRGRPSGRQ